MDIWRRKKSQIWRKNKKTGSEDDQDLWKRIWRIGVDVSQCLELFSTMLPPARLAKELGQILCEISVG